MDVALRQEVADLLRRGTDEKMMRGGGAREPLEEAWQKATRLGSPWRQVAAYRLAHVLMRDAEPDLERASALFREAGDDDPLGPLPWVYLAAVEHRLGRSARPALQKALERLGERLPPRRERPGELHAGLQARDHDLLELAVYFTGEPYWLAGHGGQWENLFPGTDAWVLIGPEPALEEVRYSREMALAELRAREKAGAVVFEGSSPGRVRAHGGRSERLTEPQFRLLTLITLDRSGPEIEEEMELTPEAYRQAKLRLGRLLARLQGLEGSAFTNPASLPRYGAVPARLITRESRSPFYAVPSTAREDR